MNLVLIGHRGSGKTTVGHAVAVRLGGPFIDLDDATLSRFRMSSVTEVWERRGEPAWRDAEAAALIDLQLDRVADGGAPPLVVALGGGTPTVEAARRALLAARTNGGVYIVWLQVPIATIVQRLATSPGDRPLLAVPRERACDSGDALVQHERLLGEREPIYAELADLTVVSTDSVEKTATAIVDAWLAAHGRS